MSEQALAESVWHTWSANKDLRHQFMWRHLGLCLARQIRAMRAERGWSQDELAERSGLTAQTIGRYERSCCQANIQNLMRLASAFDVALMCRFGTFSELLVVMADGVTCVPKSFEQEMLLAEDGAPEKP